MADACTFLMENYNGEEHVNIGTGEEITIKELAEVIRKVVGFKGNIRFNTSMPDGTPRKLTDIAKLTSLGWRYKVKLEDGIKMAYKCFSEECR
jgi:GDP-L-fucose synthase